MLDELLLLFDLAHVLDRGADGDELALGFFPLTVVDQLLHLLKLRRSQRDLVVAGGFVLTEQSGPHAVETVAGAGAVDRRAKAADAQHCRGHGSDDGERPAGPRALAPAAVQRLDGVAQRDRRGDGCVAHVVAERREEGGQLGLCMVGRIRGLLGGERFEEAIGAVYLVE